MKYDKNKMTLPERVCATLEALASYMFDIAPIDEKDEQLLNDKFVSQVYRFCHIASGRCQHDDWLKEFEGLEQDMILAYYTSPKELLNMRKTQ